MCKWRCPRLFVVLCPEGGGVRTGQTQQVDKESVSIFASNDATIDAGGDAPLRTTVTLDDTLLKQAQALSGLQENGPLLKAALQALIHRESALRLARLGGSQPDLEEIPRRRPFAD